MRFESTEEAMQFLADRVGQLSERITTLENQSLAHHSALSALIAFVGQLPPLSIEMISKLLADHADSIERSAVETQENVERASEIAAYLRGIGFSEKPRPIFEVILGGKSADE